MILDGLRNPIFALDGISVRDPAAVWHEGVCYLFYTRHIGGWQESASWDIGMVATQDFREFAAESIITPKGYASPGNIARANDQWVLPVQSYPWPSEIALLYSDDLIEWSQPHHIIPADTGPGWDAVHGPIDGRQFRHQDRWYCVWTNFLAGSDHRAFGVSASWDLQAWENLTPDGPFIDGSHYYPNGGVENCAIIGTEGEWHFFASVGMSPQRLAHVSAAEPFAWPALTPDAEIILPRDAWCAYSQSAVFVDDWRAVWGKYAMLYHGQQAPDGPGTLGLALSDDLWEWAPLQERGGAE